MIEDAWVAAFGRFGLLAGLAAVFGLILHRARVPGGRPAAAALGGVVAGVLIGPAVLGSARPGLHAALFEGAGAERAELADLEASHRRELAVLRESGVSPEAIAERIAAQRVERQPLEDELDEAVERWRMPARRMTSAWIAACALTGTVAARRRRRGAILSRVLRDADDSFVLPVAGASILVAGLIAALLATWLLGVPRDLAIAVGAATGAGSVFSRTPMRWIGREGRSPSAEAFGGAGVFFAAAVFVLALTREQSHWLLAPLAGFFAGSMISSTGRISRRARRNARRALLWLGLSTLTGVVIAETDPRAVFETWRVGGYVVATVLLSGVGQWIGAGAAGRALAGGPMHERPTAWWIEAHARGVPLTQICFAALLSASGAVEPSSPIGGAILLGLVVGAIEFELTLPATRRVLATTMRLEEAA